MPTSIGHVVGGYTAVELVGARPGSTPRSRLLWILGLSIVAANAPDLDFLPGLILGRATAFHRGPTHSLLATLVVPLLLAGLTRRWTGSFWTVFLATWAAYSSHVVLDLLIPDPLGEGGIGLLWPFSRRPFSFELALLEPFDGLRRFDAVGLNVSFTRTLLSWTGVRVFLVDAVLVSPLLLLVPLARALRSRAGRRRTLAAAE
ncbi:MAG: metal-dependent hydrolase [Gemmatimonadota bacterium]|nr:metal-dependent hydrolase [Gemmatimonadota bacterium]